MAPFAVSTAILFLAALAGMWIYATIAGLLGATEAYWLGGKGWFLPSFGMLVLAFGAVPATFVVKKLMMRARGVAASTRVLITIGLMQGLGMYPVLSVVSSLMRSALVSMGIEVRGFAELVVVIVNVTIAFTLSSIIPTLIVIALVKNGRSANTPRLSG